MQSLYQKDLEQACSDILFKNMAYQDQAVYMLYDEESPFAIELSQSYKAILPKNAILREFKNPPQPLYRGGFINQENPYASTQNRIITSHNIVENNEK